MNNSSGFVTPAPTFWTRLYRPVVAVIGQKEVENQTLSICTRQNGDLGVLTIDEILPRLQEAIAWGWYPTPQE